MGDRVEMVVKVHCGTVLKDVFSTWRQFVPQNGRSPLKLKVANRVLYVSQMEVMEGNGKCFTSQQ